MSASVMGTVMVCWVEVSWNSLWDRDPLALRREEGGGLLPRRLDHDAGRVPGLVGLLLGYEVDAVVVVALPGGVARAEAVEIRCRGRGTPLLVGGGHLEDVVPALREGNLHGHGGGAGGDLALPALLELAPALPGVHAVAFGLANAVPLDLLEGHRRLDPRGHLAAGRHGGHLGAHPVLHVHEVARALEGQVPRRGMHGEGGPSRDGLPRHVRHVPLEGVGVGLARLEVRGEIQVQEAVLVELHLLLVDLAAHVLPALEPGVHEVGVEVRGEPVLDRLGDGVEGLLGEGDLHGAPAHGGAEEVPGRHDPLESGTGHVVGPAHVHVHPEIGFPVGGHEEAPVGGAALALHGDGDGVAPEGPALRDLDRPVGGGPVVEGHRSLVHLAVVAVLEDDLGLRPGGEEGHSFGRVTPEDGLEVDLLAQLVDPAVGEDAAPEEGLGLLEVEGDTEVPAPHALVPVAHHVGRVRALARHHHEGGHPGHIPGIHLEAGPHVRVGGEDDAALVRLPPPEDLVVHRADFHVRTLHGARRVEGRHHHEGVQGAVLHADAEVGHLHQGGRRLLRREHAHGEGVLALNCGPDQSLPLRVENLGKVKAEGAHGVGHDFEGALLGLHVGQPVRRPALGYALGVENPPVHPEDRGDEVVLAHGLQPLVEGPDVAGVEGKLGTARCFPHAVARAEACHGALVPVDSMPEPVVAQGLAVGGGEVPLHDEGVGACGLELHPQRVEGNARPAGVVGLFLIVRRGLFLGFLSQRQGNGLGRIRDVPDADLSPDLFGGNSEGESDLVVELHAALFVATETVHEEGGLHDEVVRLGRLGGGFPLDAG